MDSGLITDSVASHNGYAGIDFGGPGSLLGNTVSNNTTTNFYLGRDVATSILVDRNSTFGLSSFYNYYITSGTTGVVITVNNTGN